MGAVDDELVTTKDIAILLKITSATVNNRAADKVLFPKVKSFKPAKGGGLPVRLYSKQEVLAYFKKNPVLKVYTNQQQIQDKTATEFNVMARQFLTARRLG